MTVKGAQHQRYHNIKVPYGAKPKTENQKALFKYRRKAAAAYRAALSRHHGSQGAASGVRQIDLSTFDLSKYETKR